MHFYSCSLFPLNHMKGSANISGQLQITLNGLPPNASVTVIQTPQVAGTFGDIVVIDATGSGDCGYSAQQSTTSNGLQVLFSPLPECSTTTTPSSTGEPRSKSSGLSTAQIAGIAVGCFVIVLTLIVAIAMYVAKRKRLLSCLYKSEEDEYVVN